MKLGLIFLFILYSVLVSANDFELLNGKTFYQLLDVDESAKADVIQAAYRKLIKNHHPDRGGDTESSQAIIRAYQTLHNPRRRAAYDRWLKSQRREELIIYTPERNFEDLFPEVSLAMDDQCDVGCAKDLLRSLLLNRIPDFRLNYYLNKLFYSALLNDFETPLTEAAQIALGGAVIRLFQDRATTRAGSRDAHAYLNNIRNELTHLKPLSSRDGLIAKTLFKILVTRSDSAKAQREELQDKTSSPQPCGNLLHAPPLFLEFQRF